MSSIRRQTRAHQRTGGLSRAATTPPLREASRVRERFRRRRHSRPYHCGSILWGILSGLLAPVSPAIAQQPGVELQLETNVLELGEAVSVRLVCTNTGTPSLPEAAVPEGLDLKLLNPTPSSSSFTQIINGRVSQRTTFTYLMQLTALKEGTYTLGPISVEAGGTTYKTTPVRIVVRKSDTGSTRHGDRYIFAEIDVEPRSLYVTETFTATLTIGIRKVRIGGRTFEIDLLRKVLDQRRSQFSVFADGTVRSGRMTLPDSDGVPHQYEVFRVTKRVRAEEVGEKLIGPVFLKANYPTRVRVGFFGGYEISDTRRETARAEAVTVEVKAPPEEGRPPDYAGAIGRFTMSVTAKPLRVEKGQPITLTVSISGSPLEGLAGPDLTKQPELSSRFDYTADELIGDVEEDGKVFRRAIFPKQVGEQTIPPISWSFFDPRKERYVTLTSDPIKITVDPPAVTPTTIALLGNGEPQPQATALTVLTGGISPNFVDPDDVLADQTFTLTAPWAVSLAVSPLAWLIVFLAARRRALLRRDAGLARKRRARRKARARIKRALRHPHPAEQLHELADALTGFLCDHFGLPPGTLTPDEVRSLLAGHGVEEEISTEIVSFLETCDAMRYAPNATGMLSIPRSAADVSRWIEQIEGKIC